MTLIKSEFSIYGAMHSGRKINTNYTYNELNSAITNID